MHIEKLTPAPDNKTVFSWAYHVTVPPKPGCYVITTYGGDVLYVGLASTSIKGRMGSHLDSVEKCKGVDIGKPFWFYYILFEGDKVGVVERGWMNQSVLEDGDLPPLNKIFSPV